MERMALLVVGEHRFGVAIERIREIIPARPYTPLPGSGPHVCGLINLRGRIVTVVDLGARLKLPPRRPTRTTASSSWSTGESWRAWRWRRFRAS